MELYEEKIVVKIDGKDQELTFRPLGGKYLPKFYRFLSSYDKKDTESENEATKRFMQNEAAITDLHCLALATMKKTFPDEKEEVLDEFVGRNLFALVAPIIKVNLPKNA